MDIESATLLAAKISTKDVCVTVDGDRIVFAKPGESHSLVVSVSSRERILAHLEGFSEPPVVRVAKTSRIIRVRTTPARADYADQWSEDITNPTKSSVAGTADDLLAVAEMAEHASESPWEMGHFGEGSSQSAFAERQITRALLGLASDIRSQVALAGYRAF